MARKQVSGEKSARAGWKTQARYWLISVSLILLVAIGFFVYYRVEQFLTSDQRFLFRGPSEYGSPGPCLKIDGLVYASREKVVNALAEDFGRSVYLIPLEERRLRLLAIDWVRDASISRLWPDRLVVRINERTPVAFIQLPVSQDGTSFRMALIDAEGVILEPPPRASFTLPVLTGIRGEQSRRMRRDRVQMALRLVRELGKLADNVSEIDVLDAGNLKVTQQIGGRAVVLMMGNGNFLPRLQNFLNHYPEIYRRVARATTFDLRLDDRITAVEEAGKGG